MLCSSVRGRRDRSRGCRDHRDRAKPSPFRARPWTREKMHGSTNSVASVASSSPPITARPSGAICCPPSPKASAIGSMPAIMAAEVIRMGRSRREAASTTAALALSARDRLSVGGALARRALLLGKGDQQNRVGHRHADRHDRADERLDVKRRARDQPEQRHDAGDRRPARSRRRPAPSRNDWKLAASSRKIDDHGQRQPDGQARCSISLHRRNLAADLDGRPLGRLARRRDRPLARRRATRPRSAPAMFAVRLTCRFML